MKRLAKTPDDLSSQDYETVRLLVEEGCTYKQIAFQLEQTTGLRFSPDTVKHFFEPGASVCLFDRIEGVTNKDELRKWWISHANYKEAVRTFFPVDVPELDLARRSGKAEVVEETLRTELNRMEKAAQCASDDRLRYYVLKRWAESLLEYGFAFADANVGNRRALEVKHVADKLQCIARELKDNQIQAFDSVMRSFSSYLTKDFTGWQHHAGRAFQLSHDRYTGTNFMFLQHYSRQPHGLYSSASGQLEELNLGFPRMPIDSSVKRSAANSQRFDLLQFFRTWANRTGVRYVPGNSLEDALGKLPRGLIPEGWQIDSGSIHIPDVLTRADGHSLKPPAVGITDIGIFECGRKPGYPKHRLLARLNLGIQHD